MLRLSVVTPKISIARPAARQEKTQEVEFGPFAARNSGNSRAASHSPTMPMGRLMRKIQRQCRKVAMNPPSGGPSRGPISAGTVR